MSDLTIEQREFLNSQKVCLSLVFDADGMKKAEYREVMKTLGKHIAYNVTPCKEAGHTMRTRAGHCIQCNTARLAFQKRHSEQAFVYVAGSLSLSVIKVGVTNNIANRMASLNTLKYASADDWTCIYWVETRRAGEIEFSAHESLKQFAAPTKYTRFGKTVNCLETFYCSAQIAIDSIKGKVSEKLSEGFNDSLIDVYNFKSQTGNEFTRFKNDDKSIQKNNKCLEPDACQNSPLPNKAAKVKEEKENPIEETTSTNNNKTSWRDICWTDVFIKTIELVTVLLVFYFLF